MYFYHFFKVRKKKKIRNILRNVFELGKKQILNNIYIYFYKYWDIVITFNGIDCNLLEARFEFH